MKSYLKIKACTLAAEAQINRHQAAKWLERARAARLKQQHQKVEYHMKNFNGIQDHRRKEIRIEARHTYLAYGFLKGNPYRSIERHSYTQPNWDKVEDMIKRFGEGREQDLMQKFSEWKSEAEQLVDPRSPATTLVRTASFIPRTFKMITGWSSKTYNAMREALRVD